MKSRPTVAYLVMAYNPQYWYRTIISIVDQNWPNGSKVVYLMHQPEQDDSKVPELEHDLPITIKQIWVEGTWPGLWFWKYDAFFDACAEEYYLVFDEDDYYAVNYTRDAMAVLLEGKEPADIAWNNTNVDVTRGRMKTGKYPSAIGTVCARVDQMKVAFDYLRSNHPNGVYGAGHQAGALDHIYRKIIAKIFHHPQLQQHKGVRYYFRHRGAQTQCRQHREKVDFAWNGYPYDRLNKDTEKEKVDESPRAVQKRFNEGQYEKMYNESVLKNTRFLNRIAQLEREQERLITQLEKAEGTKVRK